MQAIKGLLQTVAAENQGFRTAQRLPVISETETYAEFADRFQAGRIPLGYSLSDAKQIALPLKQLSPLALYFGNPMGIAPVLENFLYAAKRERADLIVVRRQKGSLFRADGADSLNWLLDTSDEIVDTTERALSKMWHDLLERLKGRSALLQDYCCHDDSHRLLRWKVRVFPDTPPAGMPMDTVLPLTENEAKYGCYKSVWLAGDRKTLWVNVPANTANGRVFTIQEKENGPVFYVKAKVSPVHPAEGRGMIVLTPDETGLLYRRMPRDSGRSHPSDDTVMIWVEIPANTADGQLIDTTSTSTGERLQWRVIRGSKLQQPANRDRFEVHHSRFGDVFTVKDQNRTAGAFGNADESTITISASQAKKGFKLWCPMRNGKGLVVTIPAGIKDGETVRVRKLSILLHIRVSAGEVRYSERDGSDVAHAIPVKLSKSQAQNGTTISVQPLVGVREQFNIPPGVENGVILQCIGKDGGMKYLLVSVGWF